MHLFVCFFFNKRTRKIYYLKNFHFSIFYDVHTFKHFYFMTVFIYYEKNLIFALWWNLKICITNLFPFFMYFNCTIYTGVHQYIKMKIRRKICLFNRKVTVITKEKTFINLFNENFQLTYKCRINRNLQFIIQCSLNILKLSQNLIGNCALMSFQMNKSIISILCTSKVNVPVRFFRIQ